MILRQTQSLVCSMHATLVPCMQLLSRQLTHDYTLQTITELRRLTSTKTTSYSDILVDICGANHNIGLITFNRPKYLNVFGQTLLKELRTALDGFKSDRNIDAVIFTGSNNKVFSAGADVKLMQQVRKFADAWTPAADLETWEHLTQMPKPLIAAVNGLCIGGGCELAMMCDIIYAGKNAEFGQPEILIGVIPGGGGTQRLTRAIGKSRAMDMILTGSRLSAEEAEECGLVSKVFPAEQTLYEAIKLADKIGNMSKIAVQMAKESVNNSYEMTLREGCHFEKRLFHATFATKDRLEGMSAFVEKREPKFVDA